MSLGYNRICEFEDFSEPDILDVTRDVFQHEIKHFTPAFPKGAEYRKYWEIAMSVRALRDHGALRPDAVLLGVGAGTEVTLFYLTNHARQVFATDLYLDSGVWGKYAPGFMLIEPERVAPYPFERQRLVVQHMDGRRLEYPDDTFDGIFSSGSIEHFGDFTDVAHAAYEMGRVLKPGGVATLSTEYLLRGRRNGSGWNGLRFFSRENLLRYVVEASGLELVDELDTRVSPETMKSAYKSSTFARDLRKQASRQGKYPRVGEVVWSRYPHLVLTHRGYVFCSVHLTLRKGAGYATAQNGWARPARDGSIQDRAAAGPRLRLPAVIARLRGS